MNKDLADNNAIEKTLEQRGNRYGTFEDNARVTQEFMRVLQSAPNYDKLHDMHKEVYHMIFHKISRSICGDPTYVDNVHDIIGYATGLENYLKKL
jgi:hypothetical protein